MAKSVFEKWADQSEEHARVYAQEGLILDVTEAIWEKMEQIGIKKKDLAKMLGKSPAYITQLLNGSRNMTLRTLADIAFSMNIKPKFHFGEEDKVFSQQVFVKRAEPIIKCPVIVAGQENQWSGSKRLARSSQLKAVA